MTDEHYEIYAVRYAHRETNFSEVFYGNHERTPIGMDYFVWAITNGQHTVVVDLGFTEPVGRARGREFLRPPAAGLAEIGINAVEVDHVIVTHFHYDHTGNYDSFPRASFYVQDAEMRFYTGRHAPRPAFRSSLEPDDVLAFVRMNFEGRVVFVEGEHEVVPGVRVHHVGGHTPGMQIVSVETARGRAVVASDASHYYRNFEEGIPFMTHHDIPGTYEAFRRLRELAGSPELIVPGHDPLVLERLKHVGDGIVSL